MNNPLVSIIIPLYNSERYIKETILSLINQTYQNIEIIIVDDESNDESLKIVSSIEDLRIKILKQKNSGAAAARNLGLSNSNGTYIQFMDADDILMPNKIEVQVNALQYNPKNSIAVCSYCSFIDGENYLNKEVPNQSSFIYSTSDVVGFLVNLWGGNGVSNFIQTNCWLVPKSLINKVGFWRNYRCPDDDGEFFSRVVLGCSEIVYTPGTINYYRRFKTINNLSNHKSFNALKNVLLTIGLKQKYLKKAGGHPLLAHCIARQYLNYAVHTYLNNKLLSKIAFRNYQKFKIRLPLPLIGGCLIQTSAQLFGFRFALLVKKIIQILIKSGN